MLNADEIADTPAQTLAGVVVKVRAVRWANSEWWDAGGKPRAGCWGYRLAAELIGILKQIAKLQSAAPAGKA